MICLNKADQASFKHLTWNQSPSPLAADKTTRQDLNGIANLREYVAAGQVNTGGSSAVTTGSAARLGCTSPSDNGIRPAVTPGPVAASPPVAPWFIRLSSHLRSVAGRHGCLGLVPLSSSRRAADGLWSWTSWIASLLLCSYLLSSLPSLGQGLWGTNYGAIAAVSSFVPRHAPTRLHASPARLVRRAATCKAGGVDPGVYDTPLHAGALLIIWFISTLGCYFPIMAAKIPSLRIPRRFFFAIRHFGTGVLIATAFVHLLPTAFISLGNPCLGSFWTTKYQAMPGAIALAAIFLVSVIEMVLHPSRHVRSSTIVSATPATGQLAPPIGHHLCSGATMLPFRDMGSLSGRSSSLGHGLTQLSQSPVVDGDPETSRRSAPSADERTKPEPESYQDHDDGSGDSCQEPRPTPEMKRRKERLQCILLEMGILFHSVFIGMALSVSVGSDFVVLLIAIIFHQTFEGLALGARIAAIEWESKKRWQPWAMALAYGCTTPIGQAIGLATHTLYSPDSEVGLVLVGVMNAISAGLLTFASLVELLSEDFLSDESFRHLHGKQRVIACLLVFFGAFFMSLIGAWA